jgi:hypothetical protein
MKKLILQGLLIAFIFFPSSSYVTQAQRLMIGGGVGIGDGYTYYRVESGIPAVYLRGSYLFNDYLEGSASATLFIPNKDYLADEEGDRRTLVWTLDFDAHYIFTNYKKQWSFYALAGLNINFLSSKYLGKERFPNDYSDNYLGANAGIGAGYQMGKNTKLIGEMKYTLGKFHLWSLSIGLLFTLEDVFGK